MKNCILFLLCLFVMGCAKPLVVSTGPLNASFGINKDEIHADAAVEVSFFTDLICKLPDVLSDTIPFCLVE